MNRIVILPGDGIGPEVTVQARRVLEVVGERARCLIAVVRLAGQRPFEQVLEVLVDHRVDRARRRVVGVRDPIEHLVRVATGEGELPGR